MFHCFLNPWPIIEALAGDKTGKLRELEPERTCPTLGHHFHELVRVQKHSNSRIASAGRCDQQPSAAGCGYTDAVGHSDQRAGAASSLSELVSVKHSPKQQN